MLVTQNRSDAIKLSVFCDKLSCSIHNTLPFRWQFLGETKQYTVAVVQSGGYLGMNCCFGRLMGQVAPK